ncbi:MAG: maltodextrin phosphorylase [Haloplasmataceae bacterium]|jgi:starch phosphorylase|nr:maltodextrin phosphorylase [Haloplasmataceae bacterium]
MITQSFTDKNTFINEYKKRLENTFNVKFNETSSTQKYLVLANLVKELATENWSKSDEEIKNQQLKQVYYFSMEFLMGRLLTNNLMNLGVYNVVHEAFKDLGLDLNEVESSETDAGLGNGGLGRLAACFLDSMASLSYPGHGNSIRYQKGFFQQKFVDGYQIELPELWLDQEYVWEVCKPEEAVLVPLFGDLKIEEDGSVIHQNAIYVKAVPYDVPIVGHNTKTVNKLTLWEALPHNYPKEVDKTVFEESIRKISESLYPDDSTEEGKLLRVKQQYFFVSAGLRRIINEHKKVYNTMENFHEKVILHINDTHPTLLIPELMRILMDEENYSWDKAWNITQKTCAYTNHTILAEALEKWPVRYYQLLLPRIYIIVEEIDKRFKAELINYYGENNPKVKSLAIINNNIIHMAHICIVGCFSVNGVAELHTKLLKEVEMKDFNEFFPNKFNNKTNGITHRRWAYHTNPQLTQFLNKYIGQGWESDINRLDQLNAFAKDEVTKKVFYQVKQARKQILADYIELKEGIKLNVNSIFDIQVKRLHEYKRQLMNALHIMHLYNNLKENKEFYDSFYPQTFIFGAKAAGSYYIAKKIIKLINTLADVVNQDRDVFEKLKVVFVENYNVSYAELIMPAANISEQISTASKEASGTGNMKFMMNGALTIGTLDGANIEIIELAGRENAFIFGLTADEVNAFYRNKKYNPKEVYNSNPDLKRVLDQLVNGFFTKVDKDEFKDIYINLLEKGDYFFVLKDFEAYCKAQHEANEMYKHQDKWLEMALINIANSSFFSSDRTIEQYSDDIWKLRKIKFE